VHAVRDPDEVRPGSVFVALGTSRHRGAVDRALRAGARFVLTDDPSLADEGAADMGRVRVVADARRAYALLRTHEITKSFYPWVAVGWIT